MQEAAAEETASLEHGWQPDSPIHAYLRTSAAGADESPALHRVIVSINLTSYAIYNKYTYKTISRTFRQVSRKG